MAKIWNKTTHTPATTGRVKTSQGRRNIALLPDKNKKNLKNIRSGK